MFLFLGASLLLQSIFGRSVLLRLLLALLATCALLVLDVVQRPHQPPPALAAWPVTTAAPDLSTLRVVDRGPIPMPEGMAAAHASTLLAMPPGHPAALTVFWFSGDRESGPNVQIAASQYLRATGQWTPARFVVMEVLGRDRTLFRLRKGIERASGS